MNCLKIVVAIILVSCAANDTGNDIRNKKLIQMKSILWEYGSIEYQNDDYYFGSLYNKAGHRVGLFQLRKKTQTENINGSSKLMSYYDWIMIGASGIGYLEADSLKTSAEIEE